MAAGHQLGGMGGQCWAAELYQGGVRPAACAFIQEEGAGGIYSSNKKH